MASHGMTGDRVAEVYLALVRRNISAILEYRASTLIWILTSVTPLVMLAVWSSIAGNGPIVGYSQADFASYFLLLAFVRQMTNVWVAWELSGEIQSGELATKLLRPLDPLHEYVAENLADKAVRGVVLIPFVAGALVLFPMVHYQWTAPNVLLTLLAVAGAWLLFFFSQVIFGLLSFWITTSMTLHELWFAVVMLLGGMLAPIEMFPTRIAEGARLLPFRYMLSFPVEILMGRVDALQVAGGLAIIGFWFIVFACLYRYLWRLGLAKFSAVGS